VIPKRIENHTHVLGAPKDWDEAKDGKCARLWVRVVEGAWQSAWEPTPAELEMLNAGGSVVLSVIGGQPPVALHVEPANE
jgi:hypothetical protein